jgi:hypothetical protein
MIEKRTSRNHMSDWVIEYWHNRTICYCAQIGTTEQSVTDWHNKQIGTTEQSVTVQFENGRIFKRDKSHIKIVNKAVVPSSQRNPKKKNRDEEQIRYELYDTDESDEEEFDEQNTLRTKSGGEIKKPERFGDWTV